MIKTEIDDTTVEIEAWVDDPGSPGYPARFSSRPPIGLSDPGEPYTPPTFDFIIHYPDGTTKSRKELSSREEDIILEELKKCE